MQILGSRQALPGMLAVFLLLVLANLFAPFHSDDYFQQLLLRGDTLLQRDDDISLYGLFSFIDDSAENRAQMQQYGVLPWFADEQFYFRFFRPLSELTHKLDSLLAPENAAFAHAHNIIWFLLLAALVYLLVLKTFPQQKTLALLACAIFLWDGQHVATIHWIANRNALIAAVLIMLSLYAFLHWRQGARRYFLLLSLAGFAAGLLASESAIALLAYLFCYVVIVERPGLRNTVVVLLPYVLLAVIWQVLYRKAGFGADTAQGLYLEPLADFPAFILAVLQRFPVYFTAALLPMPAGLSWGGGAALPWLSPLITLFSVCFMLWVIWRLRALLAADRRVLFWFCAGMLAVLPVCATLSQDRLSLLQTIGVDIALAAIILRLSEGRDLQPLSEAFSKTLLKALVLIHLLLSPLHLLAGSVYMTLAAQEVRDRALNIAADGKLHNKTLVVLQAPIGEATSLLGIRRFYRYDTPARFLWFASDEQALQVQQADAHSLLLEKPAGFGSGLEATFGSRRQYAAGENIAINGATITVQLLTNQGLPQQILVRFDQALKDDNLLLLNWHGGKYKALEIQ